MSAQTSDQPVAKEVARLKQAALQHGRGLKWLLGVALLGSVVTGLAVWFHEPARDRDETHFGLAAGSAGAIFCLVCLLGRGLHPKPAARCPQCGCDWNLESQNDAQTWLAWQRCPGCGMSTR